VTERREEESWNERMRDLKELKAAEVRTAKV
jgi:hypothetical protein